VITLAILQEYEHRVGILEELLNLGCLVITNCLVITKWTFTKDDLSFIVDRLEIRH
jgi:hypothetical protein